MNSNTNFKNKPAIRVSKVKQSGRSQVAVLCIAVLIAAFALAFGQGSGGENGLAQQVAELRARVDVLEAGGLALPMLSVTNDDSSPYSNIVPYSLETEDFNTAQAFLSYTPYDPDGEITVLRGGYYRVSFRFQATAHLHNAGAVADLYLNGALIDESSFDSNSYSHTGSSPVALDRIHKLEAGDVLQVKWLILGNGSRHDRLQIEYLGE